MSSQKGSPNGQVLTPEEQLRNLVEGLCEEPFYLDTPEDTVFDDPAVESKRELLEYTKATVKNQIEDILDITILPFSVGFVLKESQQNQTPQRSRSVQQSQSIEKRGKLKKDEKQSKGRKGTHLSKTRKKP